MNQNEPSEKTLIQKIQSWAKRQPVKRVLIFDICLLVLAVLVGWQVRQFCYSDHQFVFFHFGVLLSEIVFGTVALALLIFRWQKFTIDRRGIHINKLFLWWLVTVWLSLFAAMNSEAAPTQTSSGAIIQHVTTASQGTASGKIVACIMWLILAMILLGMAAYLIIYTLCAFHLINCGNSGKSAPTAPPSGSGNLQPKLTVVGSQNINPNVGLPANIFYITNGALVSNTAGLPVRTLPPFISINGQPIPNGSQVDSAMPGFTQTPSIGIWLATNALADPILDPTHPYIAIYNFTVLTTTNLAGNWQEAETVVGWANANYSVPLTTTVTYTNGVALSTNFMQAYLDTGYQNGYIIVYGPLPVINFPTNTATANVIAKGTVPPPPPGGTNAAVMSATGRYFQLTCSTNAVKTSWP